MDKISKDDFNRIYSQYRHGCVFCEPDEKLILFRNDHFTVMLDVAPVRPGHLILLSNDHLSCGGALPASHTKDFAELRRTFCHDYNRYLGGFTLYEHGRVGHCMSDGVEHRLCHHFHLHLVPGATTMHRVLGERFYGVSVSQYENVVEAYEEYGDYLYVEHGEERMFFVVDAPIERHLLRTLMSTEDGQPELANWRECASPERLNESIAILSDFYHTTKAG